MPPVKKGSTIEDTTIEGLYPVCSVCRLASSRNMSCPFCGQTFCETHWPQHAAWERRHEGLAEDMSKIFLKEVSTILTTSASHDPDYWPVVTWPL